MPAELRLFRLIRPDEDDNENAITLREQDFESESETEEEKAAIRREGRMTRKERVVAQAQIDAYEWGMRGESDSEDEYGREKPKHDCYAAKGLIYCTYASCKEFFTSHYEMKVHKRDYHDYCVRCDEDCSSFDDLVTHKTQSLKHIACPHCGSDFKKEEHFRMHVEQNCREMQLFICPGAKCRRKFNAVTAFFHHIERQQCRSIDASELHEQRDRKKLYYTLIEQQDKRDFDDHRIVDLVASSAKACGDTVPRYITDYITAYEAVMGPISFYDWSTCDYDAKDILVTETGQTWTGKCEDWYATTFTNSAAPEVSSWEESMPGQSESHKSSWNKRKHTGESRKGDGNKKKHAGQSRKGGGGSAKQLLRNAVEPARSLYQLERELDVLDFWPDSLTSLGWGEEPSEEEVWGCPPKEMDKSAQGPADRKWYERMPNPKGRLRVDISKPMTWDPAHPKFTGEAYLCTGTGEYECVFSSCGFASEKKESLMEHLQSGVHAQDRAGSCHDCDMRFHSVGQRLLHYTNGRGQCDQRTSDATFKKVIDKYSGGFLKVIRNGCAITDADLRMTSAARFDLYKRTPVEYEVIRPSRPF